jgi:branched-chain amino acid transport system ATP-binding protein
MALLEVSELSIQFGGVKAVQAVSFSIDAGMIYAVIGPNGAGKTTLFNLITGVYAPTAGSIRLDGQPVHGLTPDRLAQRGVARTFQNLQVCMNMLAIENVMVGAHLRLDRSLFKAALRWPALRRADAALRDEAAELMRFVGLAQYLTARADSMPYGALKRLEIARALAMRPRLLFLDEPAAGLNPKETQEVGVQIQRTHPVVDRVGWAERGELGGQRGKHGVGAWVEGLRFAGCGVEVCGALALRWLRRQ